ncbi:MAG TPA: hypothetical protein VM166_14315 [Gemmatimonadaceae bacterium]|nr:hypothetical protein [Gemmatimonadaceae bacterium]
MASNRRPRSAPARSLATDTPSLRARFLTLMGEKISKRLKDLPVKPPKTPTSVARERTLIESFLEGFEKGKICGQMEQNLDAGIKFLQENGNDPALQQECDALRNSVVEKLGIYASNC